MRILNLKFKNINSLTGDWEIDFTDNAYTTSGLFAITGPTGAGKSTILDAISLALYGRTPRVENVTASENELMSRHTGECSAEVIFENHKGRFLCHWHQNRAYGKATGKLQPLRHEISNMADGKPLGSNLTETRQKIIEVTGMDFNQFTRSVLLAQGEFSKFLKAKPDDRSPMLEKITGTAIYSDISIEVHNRHKAENDTLNALKAKMDGIELLSDEVMQALLQDQAECNTKQEALKAQITEIQTAISGLETISRLTEELGGIAHEKQTLVEQIEDFASQQNRLNQAIKAETLASDFAALDEVRKQYQGFVDQLKALENAQPDLQDKEQKAKEALETAKTATVLAKDAQHEGSQAITQMRLLDQKIADQQKIVNGLDGELKTHQQTHADALQKQAEVKAEQTKKDAEIAGNTQWLANHQEDEWLVGHFEALRRQLDVLVQQAKNIKSSKNEVVLAGKAVETAKAAWEQAKGQTISKQNDVDTIVAQIAEKQQGIATLLNGKEKSDYDDRLKELQNSQRMSIVVASLEEHRARLKDGVPCPCCGALEHPFALGNMPKPDQFDAEIAEKTALLANYERLQGEIVALREKSGPAQNALTEAKVTESQAETAYEQAQSTQVSAEQTAKDLDATYAVQKADITSSLSPLGIGEVPENPQALIRLLEKRLSDWNTHQEAKSALIQQLNTINATLGGLDASVTSANDLVIGAGQKLAAAQATLKNEQDNRKAQYGDKKPDAEEQRLAKAVADAEAKEKSATKNHTDASTALNTNRIQQVSLVNQRKQAELDCNAKQQSFNQLLADKGFADEQSWHELRLPEEKRQELQAQADALSKRQIELNTHQESKQKELTAAQEANTATEPLETLRQKKEDAESEDQRLTEKLAEIKARLRSDDENRQSVAEQQKAVDAQQAVVTSWDKLRMLIGSADGKKFRNFAQGLTFEIMVNHANQQLIDMNGRYLLQRDRENPLSLCVIDNWQGGEVRSVVNLSGGESFIISLALALGLSKMASKNARIDSLFLDEGFGTLDEETLNTAIETLSGLHEEGKLIGVISHIPLVKERITTQIEVIMGKGGVSRLRGPGISSC